MINHSWGYSSVAEHSTAAACGAMEIERSPVQLRLPPVALQVLITYCMLNEFPVITECLPGDYAKSTNA